METRVLLTDPADVLKASIQEATALLDRGEIVALPTETVYGLAADIFSEAAIDRIFEAKGRPANDPLIVHLADAAQLLDVAEVPPELAEAVLELTGKFWPGALTLVLPKRECISDRITAGNQTVAVRVPGHAIFRKVIKSLGRPLAAPSANRFGKISPTSAQAVLDELGGHIPLILDGGACSEGLESTIVKLHAATPKVEIEILRAGPVTREDLRLIGKVITNRPSKRQQRLNPDVPGQSPNHYAPTTPLRLLMEPEDFAPDPDKRYALLSYRGLDEDGYLHLAEFEDIITLSPGAGKLPEAAVRLYFALRQLDQLGVDEIVAEPFPERGVGAAIMERLRRAAFNA